MKQNKRVSKYTGVYPYHKHKWAACLVMSPRRRLLGIYDTEIEAHLRYLAVYNKLSEEDKTKVTNTIKIKIYE
jgi:hypothetical protein